jgi:hypothetical protein
VPRAKKAQFGKGIISGFPAWRFGYRKLRITK